MPLIRNLHKTALIALLFLGVAVLAFHFGGWLTEDTARQRHFLSESRFAQITLGLLNYHQDYGRFPPTRYQAKANGPVHSWRVLLMPYIDMYTKELYAKYDFSEDWNSPRNLAIVQSLSLCTNLFSMNENDVANYLAIGDHDAWPSKKPLQARVVTVGRDHFLLIEYFDSNIHWAEPKY